MSAALAFVLALFGVPIVRAAARRLSVLAPVDEMSRHREPIPLLGGAAIVGAVLFAISIAGVLPLWMLLGTTGLFAVGLFDDVVALRPTRKLILQAVVVVAVLMTRQPHMNSSWPMLDAVFSALWLVSTINAFNLIDGLDGLAAGIGIAAALAIAFLGGRNGDLSLSCQALAIGGALVAFLIFNAHPASIFMGDSGALPLGFMLGAMALEAGSGATHSSRLAQAAIPLLIMLVPILDMTIASLGRAATGTPVTRRGLDHSHHTLLALGLSDRMAVIVCWSLQMIAAGCAVVIAVMPHAWLFFALPFLGAFFGLIGSFMIDLTVDEVDAARQNQPLPRLARFIRGVAYRRRMAAVGLDCTLITAAYLGAFLLRRGFVVDETIVTNLLPNVPLVAVIAYGAFSIFGLYRRGWHYRDTTDALRLANAAVASGILLVIGSYFLPLMVSGSIVVLFVVLLVGLLILSRLWFRALHIGIVWLASVSEQVNENVTLDHALQRVPVNKVDKAVSSKMPGSEKVLA